MPPSAADLEMALAAVGSLLQGALRTVDVVGRCDDYDCAVLLPAATFDGLRTVVERLERGLSALRADGAFPATVDITLGVALSEGYQDLRARCGQRLAVVAGAG
jgi:GGDEF domain-containing protein